MGAGARNGQRVVLDTVKEASAAANESLARYNAMLASVQKDRAAHERLEKQVAAVIAEAAALEQLVRDHSAQTRYLDERITKKDREAHGRMDGEVAALKLMVMARTPSLNTLFGRLRWLVTGDWHL